MKYYGIHINQFKGYMDILPMDYRAHHGIVACVYRIAGSCFITEENIKRYNEYELNYFNETLEKEIKNLTTRRRRNTWIFQPRKYILSYNEAKEYLKNNFEYKVFIKIPKSWRDIIFLF